MPRRLAAALLVALPLMATTAQAKPVDRVTITRDEWGIAHIHGKTDADAVYGMVYAQAEDDFPRIERNYLTNLGRLAEAEGESAIWQDLRQRLFIDPARLQADYAKSPVWLRALMQAWAAGLNAYLADHPDVKPKVLTRFEPWMALSFTEGSIGGDIERVPLSQLRAFYEQRQVAMTAMERGLVWREPAGSNGIAIAPAKTEGGHALLLINPHTSFFFRSELQMTSDQGLDAYGAVTWGQFFVYQGFNAHVGWMHTSSGVDNVDEFAETLVDTPTGGKGYRYGGQIRPLAQGKVTLRYARGDGSFGTRTFGTWASHHGPIVREEGGKWIAFALMNRPVPALEQSFLRTKTHDLASFLKVADLRANSSNNTLFADDKGEIAYLHPQFVPIRNPRFDYTRPVDGSDPATDWKGLHALADLPSVLNPKNGWAYNSNDAPWHAAGPDSPVKAAYPAYMDEIGDNPRGPHAIRVLGDRRNFTLDRLISAAYDPWLPAFEHLLPPLFTAAGAEPGNAERQAAIALLKGWNHRWAIDSTATTLAVNWGEALWAKRGENPDPEDDSASVWDWMEHRATPAQRLAALDQAMARLKADFGDWRVPWGAINRYQRNDGAIEQVFDDARASTPIPFASARWGSLASFGARRYPGTTRYYGTSGNSFVAAVEFGPHVTARAVSIGGESGHPASPHFADQVDRYAAGDLRPVHFQPKDLAGHTASREVLTRR
ncbi:penicillin acylase family protein [Novosphingobium sp. Fuku2-ISO-50]|uniref:penicillin acylase family protein n=1 Tax=Novosphingobium sp. Fuku2-ISO-50 TaxID=1739114 RepID=UPI00076C8C3F|nr:penicillin amidase [Novosphingobium sp. Fuku2-ISO-50]